MSRKRSANGLDNTNTNPTKKRKVNSEDNNIQQKSCLELFTDTLSFASRILLDYAGSSTMHNLIRTNILTQDEWNTLLPFNVRLEAYMSYHIDEVADDSHDINYELVLKKIKIWNDYKIDMIMNEYPYNIQFDINNNLVIKIIVWYLLLYGWDEDKIFNFDQMLKYVINSTDHSNRRVIRTRHNAHMPKISQMSFFNSAYNNNTSFQMKNTMRIKEKNKKTINVGRFLNELNNKILLKGYLNPPISGWYYIGNILANSRKKNRHHEDSSHIIYGLLGTQPNQFEEDKSENKPRDVGDLYDGENCKPNKINGYTELTFICCEMTL
eukprot:493823_1